MFIKHAFTTTAALVLAVLVLSGCDSGGSDDLSQAARTAQQLGQQGFEVKSIESRPGDNLNVRVGLSDGAKPEEAASTSARIVWQNHPVRIATLDVEASTTAGGTAHHYSRADLETAYGPRPAGLDQSPEEVANNVGRAVVPLLAGGVVIAAAVIALFVFGVSRRSRSSSPA